MTKYGIYEEMKEFAVTEGDKVLVMVTYTKELNWAFFGRVGLW